MNHLKNFNVLTIWMLVMLSLGMIFYSKKAQAITHEWTEEVTLNNGSRLLVSRSQEFLRTKEPGNPLKNSWKRGAAKIQFSWNGAVHSHSENGMLIAVGPGGNIYLIRALSREDVYQRAIPCSKPSYVSIEMKSSNEKITKNIESWMYGLERNLLMTFDADSPPPSRVTEEWRRNRDSENSASRYKQNMSVDRNHLADFCRGKV